jgi:propionyl-CoA carboxylase alpha chain
VRDLPQRISFTVSGEDVAVSYVVAPDGSADAWVSLGDPDPRAALGAVLGAEGDTAVHVLTASPHLVELVVGGKTVRAVVHCDAERTYVDSPIGHSDLAEVPRFPPPSGLVAEGSLLSPMPGAVTRLLVDEGDEVAKGSVLLILEAMKMEHPVRSPRAGVVSEIRVIAGAQVEAGALLAVIGATPAAPVAEIGSPR